MQASQLSRFKTIVHNTIFPYLTICHLPSHDLVKLQVERPENGLNSLN